MGRSPCCEKTHTNKGAWTKEEDQRLRNYILAHGEGCWRSLPKAAGLSRCGKSCRLRWINYLRPDVKRGNFSVEEDEIIVKLHSMIGNKWSSIAGKLPGRTDNEIKNYWNTHIKRRLISRGIDPQTHRPINSTGAAAKPCLDFRKTKSIASVSAADLKNSVIIPTTDNSSSIDDISSMTDDAEPPEAAEIAGGELDLNLSIGMTSRSRYTKSRSFNSSSSSSVESNNKSSFLWPPSAAAEADAPAVCVCWRLGFEKGGICTNCQLSHNGLYRFC